jgi:hypothetical protein
MLDQAHLTMAFSSFFLGLKIPGVSIKISCVSFLVKIPVIIDLVVWTFGVTIAIFWPIILLSRVDLPAFGLPIILIVEHLVVMVVV